METTKKSQIVGIKNAGIVIICCFIVAVCFSVPVGKSV